MQEFTRENLNKFAADMQEAMNAVAAKHGLKSIKMGSISYQDAFFKFGCEAMLKNDTPGAQAYGLRRSQYLGFSENILGRTFEHNGLTYTVEDLLKSGKKKAVLVANGQRYTGDHRWVAKVLNLKLDVNA